MLSTTLALSLLLALTIAQNATLFLPEFDGSIIGLSLGSDATATTYLVGCPAVTTSLSSDDNDDCGFPVPFTVTQGPSTVHYKFGSPNEVTISLDCILASTTSVSCIESIGGPSATGAEAGVTTTALSGTDVASLFAGVPLVTASSQIRNAGVSLDASGSAAATAPGVAILTATSTSLPAGLSTGSALATSVASAGSATTSAGVGTKTSTGGMPQITGNAGWVIGGAVLGAVVVGGL